MTPATIEKTISPEAMETVLVKGDLAGLKPAERVKYYQSVCESLGLNPLTQPFAYISLNGKLTLYAKRDCTDQLRRLNNISIKILSREVTEGCYVVTAQAKTPAGREDESLGAVPIDNLKGEARSNALMKCETKAKRRVTLSICGLAFLDESELESVQGLTHVNIDSTGAINGDSGWEGSGTKEAARAKGEEIIANLKQGIPYQGPKPSDEKLLEASIDKAKEQKAETKTTPKSKNFQMLKEFREIRKQYKDVGWEANYYGILGEFGVCHSNEFPETPEGTKAARQCYRAMGKDLGTLREQVAAIARIPDDRRFQGEWPDNPPEDGLPFLYNGTVYRFRKESGNWMEVK